LWPKRISYKQAIFLAYNFFVCSGHQLCPFFLFKKNLESQGETMVAKWWMFVEKKKSTPAAIVFGLENVP